MTGIENHLYRLKAFGEITTSLRQGTGAVAAIGLSQIHRAQFIHAICKAEEQGAVVITADEPSAVKLCEEINNFFGNEYALHYPARDFALRHFEGQSLEYEHKRLSVLMRLLDGRCSIVVASCEAAAQLTMPPQVMEQRMFTLRSGQNISVEQLSQRLVNAGYKYTEQVEGVCQFARRGGIMDFYPPDSPYPVRCEFWGDEIDTLSSFRIDTQRREDTLDEVSLTPAREVLSPPAELSEILEGIRLSQRGKNAAAIKEKLSREIEQLKGGIMPSSLDPYLTSIYSQSSDLYSFAGSRLLVICDPAGIKEGLKSARWQLAQDIEHLLEEGEAAHGSGNLLSDYIRLTALAESRPSLILDSFARNYGELRLKAVYNITAMQLSSWSGEMETLTEELTTYTERNYCVIVLAGTEKGADVLAQDLQGLGALRTHNAGQFMPARIMVTAGGLSCGFEYPEIRLAVITIGKTKQGTKHNLRRRNKKGKQIRDIADLSPGDYVVHISHGIGVFEGIVKKEIQGVTKDYIKIRYKGTDTLFVPVTQLDLVTKYIGGRDDGSVKLSKLNSSEWSKTRQRVKSAVSDMAKELIALYSQRINQPGYAFSPDNEWQREFEQRFEYTETDDQLRCIAEIKADMERTSPMERLLCGDVGFGKTEVALRAAFKSVMDGKQCAILVPTTILAWQHYQTFRRRMEGYPINIDLLSRFRTPKQQLDVVKKLKTGEVDIVIGTHRLVQKDIGFKDLGLVIIDEEQRFGVAHKEKLKEMRGSVDVLTLSATPIPRTLNMAMSGIRDMSTIDEAPQDRHPVQTYVMEHDDHIVADAIKRELRRGGQVFYLHNRIDSIAGCAARLQNLLPDAKIVVAHGRMSEEQLSVIWRQLLEGEADILVCTTIIEAGVDVPNCNTIIIEDADRYGLSQLYQIRGRVGRSTRRAFAYLTFRRGKVISEIAEKRLSAIKEFTAFGSGFRIAMRDLEIRGAGDILGSAQHGHMEAVGYDLYLQLLAEAVAEQKGEPVRRSTECTVDLQIGAHIPEDYIESLSQRIDVYKKIAAITTDEDSLDVTDELIDRFGEPPAAVQGLIEVALLRGKAAALGINEISQQNDKILIFPEILDMEQVAVLAQELRGRVMVSAGKRPYITVRLAKGQRPTDTIREVTDVLSRSVQGH